MFLCLLLHSSPAASRSGRAPLRHSGTSAGFSSVLAHVRTCRVATAACRLVPPAPVKSSLCTPASMYHSASPCMGLAHLLSPLCVAFRGSLPPPCVRFPRRPWSAGPYLDRFVVRVRALGLELFSAGPVRPGKAGQGGNGVCDDPMKPCLSSSGCETRPAKGEPARPVASLAPETVTDSAKRRHASEWAVGR